MQPTHRTPKARPAGSPFRSGFEDKIVPALLAGGAEYEPVRLEYSEPRPRFYTPDVVLPNGIAIELKGRFLPADRAKLLAIKAQYPDLDLRLVFQKPNTPITKGSKTTNWAWANKHDFLVAPGSRVPEHWLGELLNAESKAILDAAPRIVKQPLSVAY